jgi:PAS domain S-box-containing protein
MLGEYRMLSGLLSGLGILASQVALALERVTLSDEVVRQRCEALFRTLVQDVRDVILVLDDDLTIRYASPSATRLYGRMPIKGTKALSLIADIEQVANYPIFDPSTSEDVYRGLFRITRHDGQRRLVDVWVSDFRHDETVRGRVLTVRDVTEQHKLQDQLKFQALHDTSTGLPNRTLFIDRAKHALAMAQRTGATTVTSDVAVSYSRTMRRTDALVTVVA